jgi:hypothetical protein
VYAALPDDEQTVLETCKMVNVPRNRPAGPEVGRGIALHFLDLGARSGWSAPRPGRFTPGKDPVPILQLETCKVKAKFAL